VTRDRARKKAIRARMAVSGEAYSVASRKLDVSPPARDTAVRDVMARANATLAAPSARFEYRRETDVPVRERREQPRPGPVGRLARRAAKSLWERVSPEVDAAQLGEMFREAFLHTVGVGLLEPAADRYQVDYGAYAQMYFDGQLWGGPPGAPLRANNRDRRPGQVSDPLRLLRVLRAARQARYRDEETLRGTPCRVVAVRAGSAAFTVWIDDEHVRQIQSEWHRQGSRHGGPAKTTETFELWDFGVPADSLDWSHLPSFRAPG
jgi:hypothetical protein